MDRILDHDQAYELLPWLVNGTLAAAERESVERHVRDCVACRLAVREQQRLRGAIRELPTVPLSADQGFDRLAPQLGRRGTWRPRGSGLRPGLRIAIAAAAAVAMVALLFTLMDDRGLGDARFTTLTDAASLDATRLDVIFADGVDEEAIRALLTEIDATVIAGPSGVGRYTIRLNGKAATSLDVAAVIERLGRDRRVRFAAPSLLEEDG